MEVTHNQDGLKGSVTVKVSKDDYLPKVNERLKELRKKVNMPGFRPGHVPLSIVKKLYGKEILVEEINKLVNQALTDFIKENKLKLVGDFIPDKDKTQFNINNEEDYQFVYDYATTSSPLINYENLTVPYYKVKVDDNIIEDEIETLLKKYGQYVETDEIKDDDDIFYLTFIELDENGQPKSDGFKKDDIVLALYLLNENIRDQFIGKKVNDELNIKLSQLLKDDKNLHTLFGVKPEELENVGDDFKVVITKIKRFKPAELNEEFFKKYAPNKEIKDVEEFKKIVRENLEKYFEEKARQLFKKQVKEILTDTVEVEIPEDFLIRWLDYVQQDKPEDKRLSKEEIEKYAKDLLKGIKWNRILEQIAKDLDIKLERQDSIRAHADFIKSIYSQYGVDTDQFGEEFFLQQAEGEYDQLSDNERSNIDLYAFENKVLDALMDKVNLEEREVTEEMLNAMLEDKKQPESEQTEEKSDNSAQTEQNNQQTDEKTENTDETGQPEPQTNENSENENSAKTEQNEQLTDENSENSTETEQSEPQTDDNSEDTTKAE